MSNDAYHHLREADSQTLYARHARKDPDLGVRLYCIARLTDRHVLGYLARMDRSLRVRDAAQRRLVEV